MGDGWGRDGDGEWELERLFGVGEGTTHQIIKKLTGKEYTMSPLT